MTLTFPFASPAVFEACFLEGLERQLDDGALGAFILVLANATFEQRLWERLRGRVADHLELRAAELRTALQSGGSLAASQDDQLVFLKLLAIGLDHLDVTQLRRPGKWEVQYNLVRGLRPARMMGGAPYSGGQSRYRIASGYSGKIFQGDLVKQVTGGGVERAAASSTVPLVGVFNGCQYTDPTTGELNHGQKEETAFASMRAILAPGPLAGIPKWLS